MGSTSTMAMAAGLAAVLAAGAAAPRAGGQQGVAPSARPGVAPAEEPAGDANQEAPGEARARPRVELALCLDTSGSMTPLVDAARRQLWAIVNELALAEPTPELLVALYTFGHASHDPATGWVRQEAPLTADLDLVSQRLFALETAGGTELVGRVLDAATRELAWSADERALRAIVVAGNESADQDRELPFAEACRRAIEAGIAVHAIYCGDPADAIAPGWREVARLAEGHFATITMQDGAAVVTTPFDEELATLSAEVNATYLPFGAAGQGAWRNQRAQDDNASGLGSDAAATRAVAKCSALYVCAWDLVDALAAGSVELAKFPAEELPEAMRGMDLEQRAEHVARMGAERARLRARAGELGARRSAWLAERAGEEQRALDRALLDALRAQAGAKGLRFPTRPAAAGAQASPGDGDGGPSGAPPEVAPPRPAPARGAR